MAFFSQKTLVEGGSLLGWEVAFFHESCLVLVLGVFSFVGFKGLQILKDPLSCRSVQEHHRLETAWTILPMGLLVSLGLPSLGLLYRIDGAVEGVPLKAVGHQWFWNYTLADGSDFDSYLVPLADLQVGDFRLLEVDNRAVVPSNAQVTFITTSADVLHAFCLPSLSVKMDAVPGRINKMSTLVSPGVYYGQCSEICGVNHSFMPCVVEAKNF